MYDYFKNLRKRLSERRHPSNLPEGVSSIPNLVSGERLKEEVKKIFNDMVDKSNELIYEYARGKNGESYIGFCNEQDKIILHSKN